MFVGGKYFFDNLPRFPFLYVSVDCGGDGARGSLNLIRTVEKNLYRT